ncbi:MAG: CsbD family protein [Pyrinomonadaceae bacterium]
MGIFNSNSDEAEGKWEQVKGTVKDKAGEITGDRDLEAEGEAQNVGGKAQEGWGKIKHGVADTLDSVKDSINR